ncbi:MAG: hypothetical protein Q8P02_00650, partial [Candidatus Micrarchaeota archaeon]|nr:hypothetical protein [Candidatus Micrarchaeota archaeon]
MLVGIPSNRAHRLRPCLLNVLDALKQEGVNATVVVADGSGKGAQTQAFADQAAPGKVRVLDEHVYAEKQPAAYRFLFEGPFGGPRNIILAEAVRQKMDVVFLDDDVIPVHPFFTRFAA